MILRELVTKFGFAVDDSGIDKIDSAIERSKKGLGQVAERAQGVGKSLSTFVTLPLLALGGVAIKAASDSEEAFSKFGTVFKDVDKEAEAAANNLAKNFGLSSTAARELLGDTGDLLSGFGFTGDSALDLSKQVNELAVDLASFTNFQGGAKGASEALTKALLGERESVKALGISILDADVKAKVLENTQKGLTFETERQAKAYATLQIAQSQSKNAIGDFARTSGGFANQLRIFQARLSEVGVAFGQILLPPALKVVKVGRQLLEFFLGLNKTTKTVILVIAGLAAAIGPLIFVVSSLVLGVTTLIGGFTGLAASIGLTSGALLFLIAKFVAIAAVIALVIAVLGLIVEDIVAFFNGEDSVLGLALKAVDDFVKKFSDKFNSLPGVVRVALAAITTPIRLAVTTIRSLIDAVSSLSKGGGIGGALSAIGDRFKSGFFDFENVTQGGIGGLLGFGPTGTNVGAGSSSTSVTANNNIEVNVPPGTPPEEVAGAAQAGIENALTDIFQDTRRQVASPIAE